MYLNIETLEKNGFHLETDGKTFVSITPTDPDFKLNGKICNVIDGRGLSVREMENLADEMVNKLNNVLIMKLVD